MLKNVHPLLHPDLLFALASMGHGDEISIVDGNYPATSFAANTVLGRPIEISVGVIEALNAVLTVFPIDTFDLERAPVRAMLPVGDNQPLPLVVQAATPIFAALGNKIEMVERFSFYEATKKTFFILHCCEPLPYGNFIIRMGVVNVEELLKAGKAG